jgi:hypothetical protein
MIVKIHSNFLTWPQSTEAVSSTKSTYCHKIYNEGVFLSSGTIYNRYHTFKGYLFANTYTVTHIAHFQLVFVNYK